MYDIRHNRKDTSDILIAPVRLLRVEFLRWVLRHINQSLRRLERVAVSALVLLHLRDELIRSVLIDPAEWPAGKRWKTESENGSDISFQWVREDILLEAENCVVYEPRNHSQQLVLIRKAAFWLERVSTDDIEGFLVDFTGSFTLLLINKDPFPRFPT